MIEKFGTYLKTIKRYSEHTVKAYVSDLTQLDLYLSLNGKTLNTPEEINSRDLREWIMFLFDSGNQSASVNRKISSVKTFYSYLLKNSFVESDPSQKVVTPKKQKRLPVFMTNEQINCVIDSISDSVDFVECRDKLIIHIFYMTGIRLSELIGLELSDVDYEKSTIKVLGKGGKERIIPLSSGLLFEIKKYVKIRNDYLNNMPKKAIFTSKNNNLILTEKGVKAYGNLIYKIVKKHLQNAVSLKKVSPHVLRHTFATAMLNEGADINAIKHLLGHSSLAATEVYTHNTFEKLKKVYKQAHPRA